MRFDTTHRLTARAGSWDLAANASCTPIATPRGGAGRSRYRRRKSPARSMRFRNSQSSMGANIPRTLPESRGHAVRSASGSLLFICN